MEFSLGVTISIGKPIASCIKFFFCPFYWLHHFKNYICSLLQIFTYGRWVWNICQVDYVSWIIILIMTLIWNLGGKNTFIPPNTVTVASVKDSIKPQENIQQKFSTRFFWAGYSPPPQKRVITLKRDHSNINTWVVRHMLFLHRDTVKRNLTTGRGGTKLSSIQD